MAVRLQVIVRSEAGDAQGEELILDEDAILIGRDKSCQVVLAQQAVSRSHARISRDGTLFFLEDLGSAYGTQINGQKLPRGEKRLLRDGDTIAIAQFDVTFGRVVEEVVSDKTSVLARAALKEQLRGLGGAEGSFFRIMNGPREGERLTLQEGQELVLGREEGVEVLLKDDLVSRRHAKIRRDWSGTHVEDLGSRNGIKVNRKAVDRRTLKDKDELEVGSTRFLFLDPSEVSENSMLLDEIEPTHHDAPAKEDPPEESAADEEAGDAEGGSEESAEDGAGEEAAAEDGAAEPGEGEAEENPDVDSPGPEDEPAAPAELAASPGPSAAAKFIPLVAMGVFALVAVILIVLVLAGA